MGWWDKASAKYPSNWKELSKEVLIRDAYRCRKCFKDVSNTKQRAVHHIVPLSKGGSNFKNNLMTLCHDCHEKEHPHMEHRKSKFGAKKEVKLNFNKSKNSFYKKVSNDPILSGFFKKPKRKF